MPNFCFLGSIIKKKYPKVADPFKLDFKHINSCTILRFVVKVRGVSDDDLCFVLLVVTLMHILQFKYTAQASKNKANFYYLFLLTVNEQKLKILFLSGKIRRRMEICSSQTMDGVL